MVCPDCYSTYDYDDCLAQNKRATCSFVRFPRHSQSRMRKKCGSSLLKTIKTASRKILFRPIKVFCYRSLIEQIKHVVNQPKMLDILSQWKSRAIPTGIMADIFDGKVWKSFLTINGEEFLSSRYTLALSLNADWFNPYKHIEYSVGAMYIAILNYPRQLRYLHKNILLVLDLGFLSAEENERIQTLVNKFVTPTDIGGGSHKRLHQGSVLLRLISGKIGL